MDWIPSERPVAGGGDDAIRRAPGIADHVATDAAWATAVAPSARPGSESLVFAVLSGHRRALSARQ
ncbi:hypothetical protein [Lysobacter gummosus]|uniref:hypothetical protein n=1 Tax=Lysobacter gummosus TaxID=262324 RepID=UPI00363C4444